MIIKKFKIWYNQHFNKKTELIVCSTIALILLILFILMVVAHSLHDNNSIQIMSFINHPATQVIMCILAMIVQFWFGRQYYINSYKEIFKWKSLGMNTLIASSTIVAFLYSFILMFIKFFDSVNFESIDTMFEAGSTVITVALIGDAITENIRQKAVGDLTNLEKLKEPYVYVKTKDNVIQKNINEVKIGDIIFVAKGNKIPLDGILIDDNALIDESILTGEAKPVLKSKNDSLMSGTINIGNSFELKVNKLLDESYLNVIIEKVEELQSQKIKVQKFADKIASYFTPTVLVLALLGFLVQFFLGNVFHNWYIDLNNNYLITWEGPNTPATGYVSLQQVSQSIYLFITVLIIACPCSLGLAAPLAIAVGSSKAATHGILINNIDVFEKMKLVNAIAFDKTGTLTTGSFVIEKVIGDSNYLNYIYWLEKHSLHPLAKSYVNWFEKNNRDYKQLDFDSIEEIAGIGIVGKLAKANYTISSLQYVKNNKFLINESIQKEIDSLDDDKLYSFIVLTKNKQVITVIVLSDELRDNVVKAIEHFNKMKIKTYLITGDNNKAAQYLGKQLNFTKIYSEVKPEDKANIVSEIQNQNNFVAFVGDGLNDVLALQKADLKIVMNQGSEAAKSISDIILVKGDIFNVYRAIKISLETKRFVLFNLIWAFSYNVITIPLAIFGFVNPILAAVIMAFSSISVLTNSLVFKVKKIK